MYNDIKYKNEHKVWLATFGFECLPGEITEILGIKPTEIQIKGETRLVGKMNKKMLNKQNAWILRSEIPITNSLEEHIKHLLKKIEPHKQNFMNLSKKCIFQLNCAIYNYEVNPGISLENNILKQISDLNISLYFDIYCLEGTVRKLEDLEENEDLTSKLSKVDFISKLNDEQHDEAKVLVESLREIEGVTYDFNQKYLPDLFWDDLTNEEYKERFAKIGKNLKAILRYIKQSKLLKRLIDEEVLDSN